MPRIKNLPPSEYKRSKLVWGIVYLVLLLLIAGTAWIQLAPDGRVVAQSQKQYWANVAVSASRGDIDDRNGVHLAVSAPTVSFFIDPKYWDTGSADVLIPYFGRAAAKKFSAPLGGRFHWVVRNMPYAKAAKIAELNIPGLYTLSEKTRVYPHGPLGFHVMGFCDIDAYGQAGVELTWNHILFSPPRTRYLTRDSKGTALDVMGGKSGIVKDTSGSINLTIDSRIQQIVELRLAEVATGAAAAWAAAVCVDPKTGEILALASYPTVDANKRKSLRNQESVRNNVVGRVFEPGSIFKPITMSIALETAAASQNSRYYCKGSMILADRVMRDVNQRAHGAQNTTQVLMNSCNIGMSLMSMGVPKYQAYGMLRQYGFGEKTEIEMPGEESGLMKSPEEWLGTVPANIFIGQGIAVTPLQIVMAISAVANGGYVLKPYVIKEVRDSTGKIIHSGAKRVRYQVISKKTSDFMRSAMKMVVSDGGGKGAKSDKVKIAGKTGTAQIATAGEYVKGHYVASFVGFWPADNPKYAMLITLGEPKGARYYGGQIAAPVFKNIVEDIVQIMPCETK